MKRPLKSDKIRGAPRVATCVGPPLYVRTVARSQKFSGNFSRQKSLCLIRNDLVRLLISIMTLLDLSFDKVDGFDRKNRRAHVSNW
jgi:hypothetical protein